MNNSCDQLSIHAQFLLLKTIVLMVRFDFVEDLVREKAEWRSALIRYGVPSVTPPGAAKILMSFAGSWDSLL